MMGGVSTDIEGETPLKGLYSAGEAACVSINGANRLGSNSLPECLVFGARAGRAAAHAATEAKKAPVTVLAQARDERRRLEENFLRKSSGKERVATIREEMQAAMERGVGIYRDQATLRQAADKIRELAARFQNIALDDHSRTFNTELTSALELACMLDVAETMVAAALERTESRGAHQRTDFPARDDVKFLAHSLVKRGADGRPQVGYIPVKITRWPPGERVYGVGSAEKEKVVAHG
jgi:fumarate reductase flavoprotein subunit